MVLVGVAIARDMLNGMTVSEAEKLHSKTKYEIVKFLNLVLRAAHKPAFRRANPNLHLPQTNLGPVKSLRAETGDWLIVIDALERSAKEALDHVEVP
jgi:hypothetical protein